MAIVSDAVCANDDCARIVHAKWTGKCRNHHREYLAQRETVGVKLCTKCHEEKPLSDFGLRRDRKDLRPTAACKPCLAAARAEWRKANPEYGKNYYRQNRERHLAYARYQKYGILPESLEQMIQAQGGVCAICRETLDRPQVDHDHGSGRVRAVLCPNCNMAIGLMKESPTSLRAAADYLEAHAHD